MVWFGFWLHWVFGAVRRLLIEAASLAAEHWLCSKRTGSRCAGFPVPPGKPPSSIFNAFVRVLNFLQVKLVVIKFSNLLKKF